MKARLLPYHKLSKEAHRELREQLDQFYSAAPDYTAFQAPSDQRNCWEHVITCIRERLQNRSGRKLRVLEVGAGRTGFGRYLAENNLREAVEFHAHDVTRYNEEWLRGEADESFLGDILTARLPRGYDIVFSTYVFEHVTDPTAHLEKIWSLLSDEETGGDLFIFSPRYDLPGYLCPSARHLSASQEFKFALQAGWARVLALFLRKPQFLIQTDLAAFHGPFYLDADAVHWVSLRDLRIWAADHQASLRTHRIGCPDFPSKDWFIKRLCTTAVQISKPGLSRGLSN
jgi:2-polyprenyl-3-methyl-5-hydroxy-6-metoxy-1,4-benzoquinol methylase